ncbi:MAG: peptidase S10 [Roseiarcus sp.]
MARRSLFSLLAVALLAASPLERGLAQQAPAKAPEPAAKEAKATPADKPRLPEDSSAKYTLTVDGRTLSFKATAGSIRLTDDNGAPQAEIAYVAYQLDGADAAKRPVTFAINGGPGAGSADPPGTGYSKIVAPGEEARKRLWSVDGDVEALSVVIRRWLIANQRLVSPKFIVGESYGGFRAPRLAKSLATAQGVGVNGLVLISPVLDFASYVGGPNDPFTLLTRLPSYAAAYREKKGPVTEADVGDVESYAVGDYLQDWLRGPGDRAAVERMEQRVAALTGMDPQIVRRLGGRVDKDDFLHEFERAQGKVVAFYDASVDAYDPFPTDAWSRSLDPIAAGFDAPFSSAVADLYQHKLGWRTDDRYELLNGAVEKGWNWGGRLHAPESITALRQMLALDPNFRVLISHGLTDVQAPYFATKLELDQIPDYGAPGRLILKVYDGGHMHYSRDDARKALHDDARRLIERP